MSYPSHHGGDPLRFLTGSRKHVIHAVGPVYSPRNVETNAVQLFSCYKVSLDIAVQNDLKHIVRSRG